MDLSIVVVSWNSREHLWRCLASVASARRDVTSEIIVVDNGSTDGSADMVAHQFPWVHLIRNADNRGFASANNQAIRASTGRHVMLVNSDAVLLPNTVSVMFRYLDANASVGIVGARLLKHDGTFQASYNDFPRLWATFLVGTGLARWFLSPTYPSYPAERSQEHRDVDWLGGPCLMARRATINAVGLLDEDNFTLSEEVDWCYRVRRGGWRIAYLPEARALYGSGAGSRRFPARRRAQTYYLTAGGFRVSPRLRMSKAIFGLTFWFSGRLPALTALAAITFSRSKRVFLLLLIVCVVVVFLNWPQVHAALWGAKV